MSGDRQQQGCMRGSAELLAEHAEIIKSSRVSLGDIADLLGTRSIGVWLLILALPMVLPVPAPGISVLFGIPLMIISVQLMLGYRRAWLPAMLARRSIARADYVMIMGRILPTMRQFERVVRPRTLALALEDWTIGMALRQESQIPDRRDLRMSTEEGCDLARAFRRGRHSELQGLK
jgi:hypothetical protein